MTVFDVDKMINRVEADLEGLSLDYNKTYQFPDPEVCRLIKMLATLEAIKTSRVTQQVMLRTL